MAHAPATEEKFFLFALRRSSSGPEEHHTADKHETEKSNPSPVFPSFTPTPHPHPLSESHLAAGRVTACLPVPSSGGACKCVPPRAI